MHGGVAADKADHDQVGSHPGGAQGVKFTGLVENHLSLVKPVGFLAGQNVQFAFVHIQKFPEIVLFPFKVIIAGVFEIVNRHNGFDAQSRFCLLYTSRCV